MAPLHFRDLLNPNDRNYVHEAGADDDISEGDSKSAILDISTSDPVLHAYASAAAHDAAADSMDTWEEGSQEIEASAGGNQTLPSFPDPPPHTASAAHVHAWQGGSSTPLASSPMPGVDLNTSLPTSPRGVSSQGPHVLVQARLWDDTPPRPPL
jgi:hypothetical protein